MATKAASKKKAPARKPAKKAPPRKKTPAKASRPEPFDDLHTQGDDQAVPGHFAEVVDGPHKGRYGVVVEPAGKDDVVIRTRDDEAERIVVKYADCRPAESGRR